MRVPYRADFEKKKMECLMSMQDTYINAPISWLNLCLSYRFTKSLFGSQFFTATTL
jgi:hypothetical protein